MSPCYARPQERYRVEYSGGKWSVTDPSGSLIDRLFPKERAEALRDELQAKADRRKKRGMRACMTCGGQFQSAGIHNRMCDPCRNRGSDAMGEPCRFGTIRGRA